MECRFKDQPRDEKELRNLKSRIHRIIGQLNGIEKMLDDNRYCGDVLVQISAVESALQSVGYIVLKIISKLVCEIKPKPMIQK